MTRRVAAGWCVMANEGIELVIADTYQALGFHARAAMVREGIDQHDGCADATGYLDPDPVIEDIYALLEQVPVNTDRHTHVEDARAEYDAAGKVTKKTVVACWRTRSQCLAERIQSMIDNRE